MSEPAGRWAAATPMGRARRAGPDDGSPGDGWSRYIGACLSEGMCPVGPVIPLTDNGRLSAVNPDQEITAATGECWSGDCPAAPCRWRSYRDGATMYAPLGDWPAAYPA